MFEHPLLLWLLLLAPLVIAPGWMGFRSGRGPGAFLSAALRLAAFAALVLAIAGLRLPSKAPARRVALIAAVDQSRSIAPDQARWMSERITKVRDALGARDLIGVIGFGRDSRLVEPLGPPHPARRLRASVDRGATDISGALTAALSLFPAAAEKRILLLSDGNQTQGRALDEMAAAREEGVRIFTAIPPSSARPRVALLSFTAPDPVSAWASFAFGMRIESQAPAGARATLELLADGTPVGAEAVELKPGLNRFEMPYQVNRAGAYIMSARLNAAPPLQVLNARADIALEVTPAPRVLVVSSSPPQSLVAALGLRHYRIVQAPARGLPATAAAYLDYNAVILSGVSADQLPPPVQRALNRYVARYGGGLIATGDALRDYRFHGGPLERALPVTFEPQPQPPAREPIAVYLCIDRSNSMSYDSRNPAVRDFQRIRYAKQAAIALLRQLDDTDYAGVIAFDSQPYILSDLRPLGEDREALERKIDRLQPGGGTDFLESLEIAERQILQSAIPVREIILLTDGDTNRPYHDHDALIASLAREHIPVSTIRIGPDIENLRLLQDFAHATGGTFYRVQDIEKLPLLLVHLTRRAMNRRSSGRTRMIYRGPSAVLNGIPARSIPPIDSYAVTVAKDGAATPLAVGRAGRVTPLLATWQYGLGRSAIFAADPDSLATLSWIRWDHYAQFWSQLASWTMRRGDPGMFTIRLRGAADGGLEIDAIKADRTPSANLWCRIAGAAKGRATDVAMTQVGPTLYRGEAARPARGKYTATLMLKAGDREHVILRREFAAVGAPPADSAELELRPPDVSLMRALAQRSGGEFDAPLSRICAHPGATVVVYRGATELLIVLAIILILAEIFVRRRILGE